MGGVRRFEDLDSWIKARELTRRVYALAAEKPFASDSGLRDQIQRASVSVMNNIAEGFERGSNKDFVKFLFIAKASAGEVRSLLYVASDLDYIPSDTTRELQELCIENARLIWGLIKTLREKPDWKTGMKP